LKTRKITLFCFAAAVSLIISGCGEVKTYEVYSENENRAKPESFVAAENADYQLSWDSVAGRVLLKNKNNGAVRSTTPYQILDNNYETGGKKNNPKTESPIAVTYFDKVSYSEKTAYAYTASIQKKSYSVKETDNGLSVQYDFKSESLSVTVDYVLNNDNLTMSVDTSKIRETSEKFITKITFAPFLCSKSNSDEDSYLFVPSGSGAIIKNTAKLSSPATIEEPVYGKDYTAGEVSEFSKKKAVRMPVFGLVEANGGVCAIITDGAEAANIATYTNDKNIGYSSAYASFQTRGMDTVEVSTDFAGASGQIYSEPITDRIYSVSYYPFYKENASYVDIADIYRNYLDKNYGLNNNTSDTKEKIINLSFIGGTVCNKDFIGIPYKSIYAITDINQVNDITEAAKEFVDNSLNISLFGFSNSGLSIGKPAGGIKLNSKLSSVGEMKSFFEKCKEDGISAFLNFDTVCFNKSGSGISTRSSAVTVNGKRATRTLKAVWSGIADKNQSAYMLIGRSQLDKINSKLLKYFSKSGFTGISLDTLTSRAYSDYRDSNYYAKLNTEKQITEILKRYRSAGISVLASDANVFAALNSDFVISTPTNSSDYNVYDYDVPFYQIVLKGYVAMASEPVNTAADSELSLLHCMESGIAPSYVLGADYDEELSNSESRNIYAYNSDFVITELKRLKEAHFFEDIERLNGAKIISHRVLDNAVRITEFDNGITVYVNFSDSQQEIPEGIIEAKSYYIKAVE